MTDKFYNAWCWIGRILLPACAVLYATIGKLWNLPYITEVPATITAVAVFINALLKRQSDNYFSDKLIVDNTQEIE